MKSAAPPPAAGRCVSIHNGYPGLRFSRPAVTALVRTLDAHADRFLGGCPPGELSLAFLTDAELTGIHAAFLADPTSTDVITFAGDPTLGTAGEICVSVDTARAYARRHRRGSSGELALYLVHGWLHLAGYDDLAPARKRRMRAAERRALAILGPAIGRLFLVR